MSGEFDETTLSVKRLKGMQDISEDASRTKRDLQDRVMELMGGFGYRHLETPILEPTDLFMRKSGGELASRIYSFADPGSHLVSLRPEFTSSIMRHYVEHASGIDLPVRWQYAGPVFRYEVAQPEASGQFTQIGAELLGSSSVMADVEVLGLAAHVLSHVGLADWRLELADLDVLNSVLDAVGVSERARTFIIGNVPRLRQGREAVNSVLEDALELRLTGHGDEDHYLGQAVEGLDDDRARVVLRGLLQWSAVDQLGQRNPDEIVDRLLRKLRGSDNEITLRRALELACDLAVAGGQTGSPDETLEAAKTVVRAAGANETAFNRLSELIELVLSDSRISGHLVLDFGLVRSLAYYNGIIFEVKHPAWPESLGGGGRYDGLARALGSPEPVPALGFAYNLEALLKLSGGGASGGDSASPHPEALVIAADPGSYRRTLEATEELRRQGVLAELDVGGRSLESALAYARGRDMTRVVVVYPDGNLANHEVK